uniref:A kinase (PRKA) anchor protein 17A n=1 Tax=Xiphophorus couchianus TaxID=32473 RepID=A0A3B5MHG3_9TELE
MTTTIVHDTTEAVCLSAEHNLYLKPIAKMTISVALPQLKLPGKSISNWEVMERVKAMVAPEQFSALRISKSTLDYIRFEGEVENKTVVKSLLTRLDGKTIKLSGFTDVLKVRAVENKVDFPTRHDWDSFFRDAKDMNETLPGERPDTIHLEGLPCRWFSQRNSQFPDRPSEAVLTAVFQAFGKVRHVDIPMLDPYREEMLDKNFSTFSFGGHLNFEAYVQYQEYCGFTKAMDSLRGMKLMLKGDDEKAVACNIKVIFDTSKHLSDASIKRRNQERLKLQELERQREEQKRREKEEEERRKEEEREMEEEEKERKKEERIRKREQKLREKEERRNLKKVKRQQEQEQKKLQVKIAMEERRLLLAQRNLESIRLIAELLARAKVLNERSTLEQARQKEELARLQQLETCRLRQEQELRRVEVEKQRALELQRKENELRERLLCNLIKKSTVAADPHDLAAPPTKEAAPDFSDTDEGKEKQVSRSVQSELLEKNQSKERRGRDEKKEEFVRCAHSGEQGCERSSHSRGGRRRSQSSSRKRRSSSRRRRSHRTSDGHHRERRRSSSRRSSRGRSLSSSGRSHDRGRSQGRNHTRYSRRRSKDYRSHSHHSRRYRRHSDSRGRSHSRGY